MKHIGYLMPEDKMHKLTARQFSLHNIGFEGFGNRIIRPFCQICQKFIEKGESFTGILKDGKIQYHHKSCKK